MRKFVILLMSAALLLFLAGCGDSGSSLVQSKVAYIHYDSTNSNYTLHVLDLNNNTDKVVGQPGQYAFAVISPDAKNIAYFADTDAGEQLFVMDIATANPKVVTTGQTFSNYDVQWLSNTELVYRSYRKPNWGAQLYRVKTDGSGETLVTTSTDICLHDPHVSLDRSMIIFDYHASGVDNGIATVKPDGTGYTTHNTVAGDYPALTAENTHYFFYDYNSSNYVLSVAKLDGTGAKALTDFEAYDPLPVSSNRILFVGYKNSTYEIYSINADGTNLKQLTNTGQNTFAGWYD